jgi:P-type Mg2+ transporter
LLLVLIFGAVLSLVLKQWTDAGIIIFIVIASSFLGFYQEYKASTALAALRLRLALTTKVLCDGKTVTLPTASLVKGDVIQLSAGNLVPADGVILTATDFLVSEGSLTGESMPVEKNLVSWLRVWPSASAPIQFFLEHRCVVVLPMY